MCRIKARNARRRHRAWHRPGCSAVPCSCRSKLNARDTRSPPSPNTGHSWKAVLPTPEPQEDEFQLVLAGILNQAASTSAKSYLPCLGPIAPRRWPPARNSDCRPPAARSAVCSPGWGGVVAQLSGHRQKRSAVYDQLRGGSLFLQVRDAGGGLPETRGHQEKSGPPPTRQRTRAALCLVADRLLQTQTGPAGTPACTSRGYADFTRSQGFRYGPEQVLVCLPQSSLELPFLGIPRQLAAGPSRPRCPCRRWRLARTPTSILADGSLRVRT